MEKGLVIVESPTKARTIGILGKEYKIMATMGTSETFRRVKWCGC